MKTGFMLLVFGMAALEGCGVDVEHKPLPPSHPASSEANEPPYSPPPNILEAPLPPATEDRGAEPHHHEHGGHGLAPSGPVKPYPLDVCLVGGEQLGKMGKPETLIYEGQEIKFCCAACVVEFKKDPPRYLAILESAGKPPQSRKPGHDPHTEHEEKR